MKEGRECCFLFPLTPSESSLQASIDFNHFAVKLCPLTRAVFASFAWLFFEFLQAPCLTFFSRFAGCPNVSSAEGFLLTHPPPPILPRPPLVFGNPICTKNPPLPLDTSSRILMGPPPRVSCLAKQRAKIHRNLLFTHLLFSETSAGFPVLPMLFG